MLFSLFPANIVFAETVASGSCGDNATWTLDSEGTLTISGSGEMKDYWYDSPWYASKNSIVSVVVNNGITHIGDAAFQDCLNITSITLPKTISTIGDNAFYGCRELERINIPEQVNIIDQYTFFGCMKLKKILLPENITTIENNAFGHCFSLCEINIPSSLQTISSSAFCRTPIETITISNEHSRYKIDNDVLVDKTSNTIVKCLKGKKGTYIVPDNIKIIGNSAFYGCKDLTNLIMPDSIVKIQSSAFEDSGLKFIHWSQNLTTIGDYAFSYADLEDISIPNSVTEVGESAFYECKSLKNVHIPQNVTNIGVYAFRNSGVENVYISEGIKTLSSKMFAYCDNLTNISIPYSVVNISSSAFVECENLKNIYYAGSADSWDAITIKSGNDILNKANLFVDCSAENITSFTLSTNELSLLVGYEEKLSVSILPKESNMTIINWSSSDESVAVVDSWGQVRGISEGTAVIIAEDETGNYMDACVVEVQNPTLVNKIELDKSQISIVEGESETITAAISPSNATNSNIVWSSSDESVATVSNGVVTAVSAGSAEIKVSSEDGNAIATCNVNVEKKYALEKISFESSKLTIDAGSTANIKVLYTPENATYKNVTWKSSRPAVATVENGTVKGISAGTSVITATSEDGGFKATCIVTVVQPVKVTGITLDKSTADIILNNTETLVATISPTDATNKNVIWKSDNANIASVENGMVSAKSVGTTKVYAISEDGEYKAECIIKVLPIPVTGITLDKTELSLNIGSTSKVNATVLPENAENKNVSWTSSNTDVADVDSNGNITAKSIGNTEIKAETEIGGYTAICKVSVLPINVSGIALSSSEVSLAEKATTTISATITPENATDKTVIWSSNNEKVATVTNGVITGISEGTAVIIAKTNDGNYTAYCAVTVTAAKVSVKSISLNQSSLTIVEGYTDTISASIKPENATNQNVLWSSNNKNVATVENGMITAVTPGTAVIIATAEDGGQIATCIVNVVSAMQDQVSKPIASVLSGAVQTGENILLLTATRGAEIHYTTDGSAPTKESKLYTEPIQITEALKLKAVAVKSGMIDSDVASFSYTIADPNVPYVSVQTNLTGNKGETTTVSVNISENSGSAGGSFNLVYDTDSVELVSVENGTYISKANPIVNDSYANNKIRTVWAGSKALSGGGEILSATFRILDSTQNDTAYFNLEKLKLADDNATKLTCLQSNGVLALMSVDTAVQDKEFLTQSVLAEDNKNLSVTVSANTEDTAKLYAAVYDDKQLIQIKSIDVMKNSEPYNIVFDTAVKDTQIIKVFVWDENMMPLSTGETVEK